MQHRRTRHLTALAAIAVAMAALCGCASDRRGTGDSPVAGRRGDDSPANVTNFPDHFANIATKCVAGAPGFRAFVTTREAAPVILADPTCKG
ncbi:hypothetical protein [Actinacidiphila rubida]|uniref:Lipoprotein n=1 Tax=Actinacidiphila rubida TaxID=310780 RepID=A0A1H8R9E0_9ACTN|nr:hypothetical protein [Actinacidiphila rubida]SEO62764.1 hypothetical protein SAMN05216267_103353 [Actinacidiphila rubida]